MICPGCNHSNPEENRFCGQCGLRLDAAAKSMLRATPAPATAKLEEKKKDLQGMAVHGAPIPHEIVEFDKQIPLIAEPGADRRRIPPAQRSLQKLQSSMCNGHEQAILRDVDQQTQDARDSVASRLERERFAYVSDDVRDAPGETAQPLDTPEEPGSRLEPEPAEAKKPVARGYLDWDENAPSGTVSGPSFLGLSGSASTLDDDEEQSETHWRRNLALFILLALGVLAAAQWRAIRDMGLEYAKTGSMKINVPRRSKEPPPSSAAMNEPNLTDQEPVISVDPTRNAAEENARLRAEAEAAKNPHSGTNSANSGTPSAQSSQPQQPGAAPTPQTPQANQAGAPAMAGPSTTTGAPNKTPGIGASPEVTSASASRNSETQKGPSSARSIDVSGTAPGEAEMRRAIQSTEPTMTMHWLWEAMKKGNPQAPVQLANMYISGRGAERNCDQALLLLRSAAANNNAQARGKLGALYATGECVQQDRVQAYHWMTLAQQLSPASEWIAQNRRMLWSQMTAAERARAR